MAKKTVWETLRSIDVSEYTKKKNGMTYLSWAHAWGALKDVYPDATFEKHVEEGNIPYMIDLHGFAYVRVTVTAGGESATELFPVLDYKNSPIKNPNAFQINTAHQRAMTKAMGYLGLGHYIYAGEDLPQGDEPEKPAAKPARKQSAGEGSGMIKATFMEFIPRAETTEELVNFYKKNEGTLKTLEELDKPSHAEVMTAFKNRKEALQKEGVADGV